MGGGGGGLAKVSGLPSGEGRVLAKVARAKVLLVFKPKKGFTKLYLIIFKGSLKPCYSKKIFSRETNSLIQYFFRGF